MYYTKFVRISLIPCRDLIIMIIIIRLENDIKMYIKVIRYLLQTHS